MVSPDFMRTICVSGGFDILTVGHCDYFRMAKALGDYLLVILNTDDFLIKKKGYFAIPFEQRRKIVESIRWVDEVVPSIDKDLTVCKTLESLADRIDMFANGGDRNSQNCVSEEVLICQKLGIEVVYLGGVKINSSSAIARRIKEYDNYTDSRWAGANIR